VKILTLWQPWATLIAVGAKKYETRSWGTSYTGELVIHSAKRKMDEDSLIFLSVFNDVFSDELTLSTDIKDYPLGVIVAHTNMTECVEMNFDTFNDLSPMESFVGDWEAGRYAWKLDEVRALQEPIPYKGSQGLKSLHPSSVQLVESTLSYF